MFKILILTICITLSISSNAQNWRNVATSKDSLEYSLRNGASFTSDDGYLNVWVRIDGKKVYHFDGSKQVQLVGGYEVSLYKIDCKNRKLKIVATYIYNVLGEIVDLFEGEEGEWIIIVPGSVSERIYNASCRQSKISTKSKKSTR